MTHAEIRAFLAICQMKNITRAAASLYISQSALSIRIRTLERELGCQLLVRSKGRREIELTREGQQFYQLALQYQDVMQKMRSLSGGRIEGSFRVASINSLGSCVLPPVYERFLEVNPKTELEIQDMETPQALESLERGMTDLSFGTSERRGPGIENMPVFSEKMMLVCSKDSPYPKRVKREDLPVNQELYNNWSDEFDLWHDETFGREVQPSVRLAIMNQIEFFLAKSDHWALVPYSVACGLLGTGKFRSCEMEFQVPQRITYCLYPAEKREHPAFRSFLTCLRETVIAMNPEQEEDKIKVLF